MNPEIFVYAGIGGFIFMAALLGFVYTRGISLLQYFQQEEYDNRRFIKWLFKARAFDKKASLLTLVSFIFWSAFKDLNPPVVNLIFFIFFIPALFIGIFTSRAKKSVIKKPLVMTARVQRILYVYLLLMGIYFAGLLLSINQGSLTALMLAFVVFFQWPPLFLVFSNFILKPVEEVINRRYLKTARGKMRQMNPVIIAIAGSYGKTSIKHILAHLLSSMAPTLATPGSVNTVMGIVRIIREKLEQKHRYFIVEMGAYGPGSIKQLCQLTPPQIGIISSVGVAHFERFKSLGAVFKTKFELAEDLGARHKLTIINAAAIPDKFLDPFLEKNPGLIVCGDIEAAYTKEFTLKQWEQTSKGLSLDLEITVGAQKQSLRLFVPLFGAHQATNVMLAVAVAVKIGLPLEVIKGALKTMPQIRHRLEVTPTRSGPTIVDDAYNSNPTGFAGALDTLSVLKKPFGRAILVSPGMVELGKVHAAQHFKLGEKAGEVVDVALIVGPKRMKSFIAGFNNTAPESATLLTFPNQKEAENWVTGNARPEDVVLFENNLPDIYEAKVRY